MLTYLDVEPVLREPTPEQWRELRQLNLVESDGVPMDTSWHRTAMNLLIASVLYHLRPRTDFYVGGNMFLYFTLAQARSQGFLGPDFFFVHGVPLQPPRPYWAVWDEGGRFPDVIVELLSPKTARADRTTKKRTYERVFRTPEYYLYDSKKKALTGFRLASTGRYRLIRPARNGRLWSEQLGLWLGTWFGAYECHEATYPRFYTPQGQLVLTEAEALAAEATALKAKNTDLVTKNTDLETKATALEAKNTDLAAKNTDLAAEVARLKAILARKGLAPNGTDL